MKNVLCRNMKFNIGIFSVKNIDLTETRHFAVLTEDKITEIIGNFR